MQGFKHRKALPHNFHSSGIAQTKKFFFHSVELFWKRNNCRKFSLKWFIAHFLSYFFRKHLLSTFFWTNEWIMIGGALWSSFLHHRTPSIKYYSICSFMNCSDSHSQQRLIWWILALSQPATFLIFFKLCARLLRELSRATSCIQIIAFKSH